MFFKLSPAQYILAAALVVTALASCTDAPITSTSALSSRRPVKPATQVDSVPAQPDSVVIPQGCVEDQQEAVVDPVTGELIPCPLGPIIVVVPPSDPPPPSPPSDPPSPPPSGGGGTPPSSDSVCDPSLDWDSNCQRCASGYVWDDATQNCINSSDVEEFGCPSSYNGQWSFVWNGHTFYVVGKVERIKVLKSWPWGEALYRLPPGPTTSTDEKAAYWSGVGRMKCYGYLSTSGHFEGIFNLVWESGDIREL